MWMFLLRATLVPKWAKINWWHNIKCDLPALSVSRKLSSAYLSWRPMALQVLRAHATYLLRCRFTLTPPCRLPPSLTHWPTGGKRGHWALQTPLLERQMAIFSLNALKRASAYIKHNLRAVQDIRLGLANREPKKANFGIKSWFEFCLQSLKTLEGGTITKCEKW